MNVLVVGTGGDVVSGITSAADQMVRTLQAMGHHVSRVEAGTHRRRRPNRLNSENAKAVLHDTATVFTAARRGRADVVWLHAFGVPTLAAMRMLFLIAAARLAGARAIAHIHAYGLEQRLEASGISLRLVLRIVGWIASDFVVLYENAARAARAVGVRNVEVLGNWVDVAEQPSAPPPAPPHRLVFVGGLVERKGVFDLVRAVELLVDVDLELTLIGGAREDGPGAQERVEAAASSQVAQGRIRFAGELRPEEVRTELRRSHVFVLPSRAEGLPIALLEAMAEGRPVVVGDAGSMRAVVESCACGVVLDVVDSPEIARAVRTLLRRDLTMLGEAGHEDARTAQQLAYAKLQALLAR